MTRRIRIAAAALLATLFAAAVCAPAIAPHSYEVRTHLDYSYLILHASHLPV